MGLGTFIDGVTHGLENSIASSRSALFEPVIRLGVTGLSRSGKTVFITSLIANLLDRGRMPQLLAAANGGIRSVYLQPQPDDTVPRFDYENHLAAMTGPKPKWPKSTRAISQLRLTLRVQPSGILAGMSGLRTIHLDIVDYPGEWLLDLPMMDQSFAQWSKTALALAESPARAKVAKDWRSALDGVKSNAPFEEADAQKLAGAFTGYLAAARQAGFSACAPGRFLMPGDLEGSPALTFAPLPPQKRNPRGSLNREMERRYNSYKSRIVKPFFRDHLARIDRQIILVDALSALNSGPTAIDDLRGAMTEILRSFRPGKNSWLSRLTGRRTERILFAATKADHLHHSQHPQLTAIMQALVRDAKNRADVAGATTQGMALAALRTTVEETINHKGAKLNCVRGVLQDTGKQAAFYPGKLPDDPAEILSQGQAGQEKWLAEDYKVMRFRPAQISLKPGFGPPHIRLDKAVEFLLGDRLR